MPRPYFVADQATVTVLKPVASSAFGSYKLSVPEDVDINDIYKFAAPGNELGYVASLAPAGHRVGGFARRFVRADVNVTAADTTDPDWVPSSDVDKVLTDAAARVEGDFFLESDITKAGLGPWIPFTHFEQGDLATVEIWGRRVPLPVTRIEPKVTDHDENDWAVHVGGQVLTDDEARLAENETLRQAAVQSRREVAGLESQTAKAVESAESAKAAANEALTAVKDADGSIANHVREATEASERAWEHSEEADQHSKDAARASLEARLASQRSSSSSAQSVSHSMLSLDYSERSREHSERSFEYSDQARKYSQKSFEYVQEAGDHVKKATDASDAASEASQASQQASQEASDASSQAKTASEASSDASQAATQAKTLTQEALRKAEEARNDAETARRSAEEARDAAETKRADAEAKRDQAEQARKRAMQSMQAAAAAMAAAEQARMWAEEERKKAEQQRMQAENERSKAESARSDAETARDQAETARSDAEEKRAAAETQRNEAEQQRKLAENARSRAINAMMAASSSMAAAEFARAEAERRRNEAEQERKLAEDKRKLAEEARQKAHEARQGAETAKAHTLAIQQFYLAGGLDVHRNLIFWNRERRTRLFDHVGAGSKKHDDLLTTTDWNQQRGLSFTAHGTWWGRVQFQIEYKAAVGGKSAVDLYTFNVGPGYRSDTFEQGASQMVFTQAHIQVEVWLPNKPEYVVEVDRETGKFIPTDVYKNPVENPVSVRSDGAVAFERGVSFYTNVAEKDKDGTYVRAKKVQIPGTDISVWPPYVKFWEP